MSQRILLLCIIFLMIGSIPLMATPSMSELFSWSTENSIINNTQNTDTIITRRDAAPIFINVAKKYWGADVINEILATKNGCTFHDIDTTLPENANINNACTLGIIHGDVQGNYNPNAHLTAAQAMAIMMRIVVGTQDETGIPWWSSYFDIATRNNIIPADDQEFIATSATIRRSKILAWIYNLIANQDKIKTDPAAKSMHVSIFGSDTFTPSTTVTGSQIIQGSRGESSSTDTSVHQNLITHTAIPGGWNNLCNKNTQWYCHWFIFGPYSGNWSWIWWLVILGLLGKFGSLFFHNDHNKPDPRYSGPYIIEDTQRSHTNPVYHQKK